MIPIDAHIDARCLLLAAALLGLTLALALLAVANARDAIEIEIVSGGTLYVHQLWLSKAISCTENWTTGLTKTDQHSCHIFGRRDLLRALLGRLRE